MVHATALHPDNYAPRGPCARAHSAVQRVLCGVPIDQRHSAHVHGFSRAEQKAYESLLVMAAGGGGV